MKCVKCGAEIPDGRMHCPKCGYEVRMVPDYNPMDDVLAGQIGGSAGRQKVRDERPDPRREQLKQERTRRAKQHQERRRQRRTLRILVFLLLILAAAAVFLVYRNTYSGLVKTGDRAYRKEEYSKALKYYNRAIAKSPSRDKAYTGYYKVYLKKDDLKTPEKKLLNVIAEYPDQTDLYEVIFQFFIDSEQSYRIAEVLDDIEDESVREKLSDYDTPAPTASLEEGEYDDVQQVSLTADGSEDIYYTVNGSEPTVDSTHYTEPIQLSEGETELQAIAVNKKGIESLPVSFNYNIELPIADAPAVTPSTGQYSGAQKIKVKIPKGYKAYYTMDGTEPGITSEEYTGPIDMPKGNTIFSVVLESPDGKLSDITKRNYERL